MQNQLECNDENKSDQQERGEKKEGFQLHKREFQVDRCRLQNRSGNSFLSISFFLSSFEEGEESFSLV